MRYVMTRVLPEPAPARMSSGPSRMQHGFALFGIEFVEEVHCRVESFKYTVSRLAALEVRGSRPAARAPIAESATSRRTHRKSASTNR